MPFPSIVQLPPNRVRRTYQGGEILDAIETGTQGVDGNRPEDWIGSCTPSVNPGMEAIADEGLSRLADGSSLAACIAANPEAVLGRSVEPRPRFLLKLLDAAVRLPMQAHPTSVFARERLGKPFGKFEAYVVLSVRPGSPGNLLLGFQRPPTKAEWRRIVLEQDLTAMHACFDPIPVTPGEVWIVPGGLPHAIGAGLTLIEAMEPSDLVVRCEASGPGINVPPTARYMGVDPDLALEIFDFTPWPLEAVKAKLRCTPRQIRQGPGWTEDELVGLGHTPCFTLTRHTVRTSCTIPLEKRLHIGVVTAGIGIISAEGQTVKVRPGSRLLLPAKTQALDFIIEENPLTIVWCHEERMAHDKPNQEGIP